MGYSASRKYPEWETQTYTYIEMAKYQKDTDQGYEWTLYRTNSCIILSVETDIDICCHWLQF